MGIRQRKGAASTPAKLRGKASESETSEEDVHAVADNSKPVEGDWLQRNEGIVHWIVLAIAAFTRYYRLDQPPGVVFDETHFGRFTNQYMRNEYFFDIHPPLGKLTFWAAGKLVGYNPNKCSFVNITDEYGPECKYVELRATAALFSTLSVWFVYHITRGWGASVYGGLVAAGLVCMDMLNVQEGRLILMDSQLFFWLVASLLIAQRWWAAINAESDGEDACVAKGVAPTHEADARIMTTRTRNIWAVAVGVVCGCAFSVKMTGLATPGIIGIESFFGLWFLRRPARFPQLLLTAFTGLAVYSFFFAVHFWLCTKHGDGDDYMNLSFQSTLIGNRNYDPEVKWDGFWRSLWYLNHRMVVHNANILEPHPWQTSWKEWVMNTRGLLYYSKDTLHTYTHCMYLLGNPAVLWSVVAFAPAALLACASYLRYATTPGLGGFAGLKPYVSQMTFCFTVYWLNLLPYLGVKRSTFIYHYMPALVYGEIMVARTLEALLPRKWVPTAARAYLLLVAAVFLFYVPWIYALPLNSEGHQRRRWLPRWN